MSMRVFATIMLFLSSVSMFAGEAGNAPQTPPKAAPRAAGVTITQQTTQSSDANADGKLNPGENVKQTTTVTNGTGTTAANVLVKVPVDPNTTLVPGSVRTTPVALDDNFVVNLDTTLIVAAPGLLANDFGIPAPAVTAAAAAATTSGGKITISANGAFTYMPPAGFVSPPFDTFTYTVTSASGSDTGVISFNVVDVNDPPFFTIGANQTAVEDAPGVQTVAGWAMGISTGAVSEAGQTLTFQVTNNSNPALFAVAPAVSSTGDLTYTLAPDAFGTANITLVLKDNGGTANGGNDTSAPQTFSITITPVNDAPAFLAGADQTVNEDAGPQTIAGWATNVSAGPVNEAAQVLTFIVTNNTNPGLFSAGPAIDAAGTLTYTTALDANGTAAITIQLKDDGGTVNGGMDTSATQTFNINVAPVNDAPVLTAGGTLNFTENDSAKAIDSSVTASDVDSANIASATIQITGNYANGEDVLSFANTANITGSFDAASGTLTLTGSDTVANYQTALRAVLYFNNSDNPSTLARTVAWIANDGTASSVAVTGTINVTAVNDAPVLAAIESGTLGYTPGSGAQPITSTTTVNDVDNTNLSSAVIQITGNYLVAEDTLGATGAVPGTITVGAFDAAAGSLALTGSATLADYQAALRAITYTNSAGVPNAAVRTVSFTVNDGALNSNTVTRNIKSDFPPVLAAIEGTVQTATENISTQITNAITVSDLDNTNIASATIQIASGYINGEDVLQFTNTGSITGSFTAASGTLTLTGSDTKANYQTALRAVNFLDNNDNSTAGNRTVVFQVNDGISLSNTQSRTVNVVSVNDAPIAVANGPYAASPNIPITFPANTLLVNCTDADGPAPITMDTTPTSITPIGTTVTLSADGSFRIVPLPGSTASITFKYRVKDASSLFSAYTTVTVTVGGNVVWFCDASAPAGGNGMLGSPFNTLAAANTAANAAGHRIFLYSGAYTGGITLTNGVLLFGAGATGTFDTTVLGATAPAGSDARPALGGTAPVITTVAAATNGINLAVGGSSTLRGIEIGTTTGSAIASGANFGTLTASETKISGTGQALALTSGALAATFSDITRSGSAGANLSLTTLTGNLTVSAGTIGNSAGDEIVINGGSANVSIAAAINNSVGYSVNISNCTGGIVNITGAINDINAGGGTAGIIVQNNTGGTINFSNAANTINSGTLQAVTLATNTGATINFNNGLALTTTTATAFGSTGGGTINFTGGLAINTTTGDGLNVSGGGTINVTGANNTVSGTGGAAVSLSGTTIGANGVTFASITSNGAGFKSGVLLNGTGANPFTVTGMTAVSNRQGGSCIKIDNTVNATFGVTNVSRGGSPGTAVGIDINTQSGTLVFAATSVSGGASGPGINVANSAVGSTITFASTTVSGSNSNGVRSVSLTNNAGNFTSNGGAIGESGGDELTITGGTGNVAIAANINNGVNRSVNITGRTVGTVDITGAINDSNVGGGSAGIIVQNCTGGTINFTNAANSISTGVLNAIVLANNAGATINFNGGPLAITTTTGAGINATGGGTFNFTGGLAINTTTGDGLNVSGGGTIIVTGANNTVSSGAGAAVSLSGVTIGAGGVTFASITSNGGGGKSGVLLNGTGANPFTVTGTMAVSTRGGGSCIKIDNTVNATFGVTNVPRGGGGLATGIDINTHSGTLAFAATTVNGSASSAGINVVNSAVDSTITFASTTVSGSNSNGVPSVTLGNLAGTFTSNGGAIGESGGDELTITGGTGNVAIAADINNRVNRSVNINGRTGGIVDITGVITDSNIGGGSAGIIVQNCTGGTVNFTNAANSISTGVLQSVRLISNAGATINFTGGLSVTSGNGNAVFASGGGIINFAVGGPAIKATGSGNAVTSTGTETINFTGSGLTISASSGTAVSSTGGGTINFTGGGLAISTATGDGINMSGGGTINVTGANNTINCATDGTAVSLSGAFVGASGVNLASITANGVSAKSGVVLNGTGANSFKVSGTTAVDSRSATSIDISNTVNANFGVTNITNRAAAAVNMTSHAGALIFGATTVSGAGAGAAIADSNSVAGSSVLFASTLMTGSTSAFASAINLSSIAGSFTISGGTISDSNGDEIIITGGAGNVTIGADINNSTNRTANIAGRTGGTVNITGAINDINAAGSSAGIAIQTCTGGTINFTNAVKTISSGAFQAVSLLNNTGATFNFSGGGLAITAPGNNGFAATGGGTVIVTGAGNTITAGGGQAALNVTNTNIGLSGLTFQSINSNGAVNGIVLNTTGTTAGVNGGLTVTGTGAAGSGGTIQGSTNGVLATSTRDLSLSFMNIINNGLNQSAAGSSNTVGGDLITGNNLAAVANVNFFTVTNASLTSVVVTGSKQMGINGNAVNGLTLTNSTVTGNGDESFESGIMLQNASGTISIIGSNVRDNRARELQIANGSGTMTFNTSNSQYGHTAAGTGTAESQQGILLQLFGTSNTTINATTLTLSNNEGTGFTANAFQLNADNGGPIVNGSITSSVFDNNAAHVLVNAGGTSTVTFDTKNNATMTKAALQAINYTVLGGSTAITANLQGTISGNTIVGGLPAANAHGIDINSGSTWAGQMGLRIDNNTVQQVSAGITALMDGNDTAGLATPRVDLRVVNNTVNTPDATAGGCAIQLSTTVTSTHAKLIVGWDVGGAGVENKVAGHWGIGSAEASIYLRQRFSGNATVILPGYGGTSTDDVAVQTYIAGRNTITAPGGIAVPVLVTHTGATPFANGTVTTP